jgi:hypothetical protein
LKLVGNARREHEEYDDGDCNALSGRDQKRALVSKALKRIAARQSANRCGVDAMQRSLQTRGGLRLTIFKRMVEIFD